MVMINLMVKGICITLTMVIVIIMTIVIVIVTVILTCIVIVKCTDILTSDSWLLVNPQA